MSPLECFVQGLRFVVVLVAVDLRLVLVPARWNQTWWFQPDRVTAAPGPKTSRRIGRQVALARRLARFRLVGNSPCLSLSLALRSCLRRWGLRPSLVFGVRKGPQGIQAHAWLQLGTETFDAAGDPSGFRKFEKFVYTHDQHPSNQR